ncbi:hypothetical protein GCM10008916_08010 [Clostridium nitritogenes]|uniref:Uncharacterized protein n=1 Tax=Clostridium nitritogenes TaxID=83340 RepID=A0ABN1LJI7_9CLOT
MSLSKLYSKCEKCKHKESCNHKKMMTCATFNTTEKAISKEKIFEAFNLPKDIKIDFGVENGEKTVAIYIDGKGSIKGMKEIR